jgi:protein gp37
MLLQPLKWKRPRKIFVCSMTDLFADFVTDEMLDRVFAVMALCPQHTFQVLTKRSARMREYLTRPGVEVRIGLEALELCCHAKFNDPRSNVGSGVKIKGSDINPGSLVNWPLAYVWLGVSVEDQRAADERIPDLLATPAAVRWLSCEPLLGPLDLTRVKRFPAGVAEKEFLNALAGAVWTDQSGLPNPDPSWAYPGRSFIGDGARGLDWVVGGGESGPGARPCHPDWARSLRDQCAAAEVPFLFKQWGEFKPYEDERADCFWLDPNGHVYGGPTNWPPLPDEPRAAMCRVGKKAAGRLLDGVLHDAYPQVAA